MSIVETHGNGDEWIEFKPDDVLYENVSYDDFCIWIDEFKTLTVVINDTRQKTFIKCSSVEVDKLFEKYAYLQYLITRLNEHFGYEIEFDSS